MTKLLLPPSLAEMWASFCDGVMPAGVGDIQKREMRRAFYAGAWATLNVCAGEVTDLPEALGVAVLERMHRECRDFAAAVEKGDA